MEEGIASFGRDKETYELFVVIWQVLPDREGTINLLEHDRLRDVMIERQRGE